MVSPQGERHAPTARNAVLDYTPKEAGTGSHVLREVAELDDIAKVLRSLTKEQLKEHQNRDIDKRAAVKVKSSVADLLRELTEDRGMSWVDIASLTGVSVSAVRKWRKGGEASAESRLGLARLSSLLDLLEELAVADPAQWMEVPMALPAGYVIRPIDLYRAGNLGGILSVASIRCDPEEVLDDTFPGWRESMSSDFEVVTGPDGYPAVQKRSPR